MSNIYGSFQKYLEEILSDMLVELSKKNHEHNNKTGYRLFEHIEGRIKNSDSMIKKLRKRKLKENTYNSLIEIKDSIGIRLICSFIDDIKEIRDYFDSSPEFQIIEEKDYIKNSKLNGYRSYHLIVSRNTPYLNVDNKKRFFIEIQIRTSAQDTWATLEHKLNYKKEYDSSNPKVKIIQEEFRKVSDELYSSDLKLQTLRKLIKNL